MYSEGGGAVKEKTVPAAKEVLHTSSLGVQALEHYNNAKVYLRQGNWTGYGEELDKMEKVLGKLGDKGDPK